MQSSAQVANGKSPLATFDDQSFRMVVFPHYGGSHVRLRLSNRFGDDPVVLDDVHVGLRKVGAALVPGSNRRATFGGQRSATIPPGEEIVSDPLTLTVRPFEALAVSFHQAGGPEHLDWHRAGLGTSYLTPAGAGAHGADESGAPYSAVTSSWYVLSAVDVLAPRRAGVVVALGDSITDGAASTYNENRRYPDELARRLLELPPERQFSVLNAGIGGNQLSNDGRAFGLGAVTRLKHDALAQTGITDLIVHGGINDLAGGVPASRIIDGYRSIIARARARGINVIGTTLTATGGSARHGGPKVMRGRDVVNRWIRTSGAFDAVYDFDAATRDPANPKRLLPVNDSGDGLHPSDAGYRAMAAAVDVDKLRGPDCDAPASPAQAECVPAPVVRLRVRRDARSATVYVNGKRVKRVPGHALRRPVKVPLPSGRRARVRVIVTRARGERSTQTRTYRRC
jgi:lysophospholipase L1-like esterase